MEQKREPEINPLYYSQMISDKGAKKICRRKDSFAINGLAKLDIRIQKNENSFLSPSTKTNAKWTKDSKCKT